jgi:hypothetical protein
MEKGAASITDTYAKIKKLEQQLAERDELIIELSKIKDKYACPDMYDFTTSHHGIVKYQRICWEDMGRIENGAICGGKLARAPLKNQRLLDEIKLTKDER